MKFSTYARVAESDLKTFIGDYKRLFAAAPAMTAFIFASHLYLGLFPRLFIDLMGRMIDAMMGASAIGVWTSDLSGVLVYQLIIVLLGLAAFQFATTLSGVARRVGFLTSEITFGISFLLLLLSAAPLICIFIVAAFIAVHYVIKKKSIRFIYSYAVLLLISPALSGLFLQSVRRERGVGETVAIFLGLIAFGVWAAFRPHFIHKTIT
jgi:hypothetical protein